MTITSELEAHILRLYHVEKWRCGTIARQLHIHRDTVRRVLAQAGLPRMGRRHADRWSIPICRSSVQTLEKFPTLTASRLYAMVRERGYQGCADHFRHLIALPPATPAGRGVPAPAHAAGRTRPGGLGPLRPSGDRPGAPAADGLRDGAVVVARDLPALLPRRPHGELPARPRRRVRRLGGVPRVLLYDNLKSAVLERQGDAIRFHPTLLALRRHTTTSSRARWRSHAATRRAASSGPSATCATPSSPRAPSRDLDDLNAQAAHWCHEQRGRSALARGHAACRARRVRRGAAPPAAVARRPACHRASVVAVTAGKTPYVRFDLNDYSVPHTPCPPHADRASPLDIWCACSTAPP